jgi:Ser/Thr protein kinase RdoA (MazF antagonist)
MSRTPSERVAGIAAGFRLGGDVVSVEPLGSGHIHETWASRVETGDGARRFVHQRINRSVFARPDQLMENIGRVTAHLREKIASEGGDPDRETLTVVPALDGASFLTADDGAPWRTFAFIEGTRSYDAPTGPEHAYQAGRAFALFQRRIADLSGPPLHETIPGFGDSHRRFAALLDALAANPLGRADGARAEIEFARGRERLADYLVDLLDDARVPTRIIHFDTKINNVLVDERTGEAVCVIDLDTVMPGTALYDFGDAVRRGAWRAAEDERDVSDIRVDADLFEGLARGYLGIARSFLTAAEIDGLIPAAEAVAHTMGVRFLADHLSGDTYFGVQREGQNLDRCRVQFALVRAIERQSDRLRAILDACR